MKKETLCGRCLNRSRGANAMVCRLCIASETMANFVEDDAIDEGRIDTIGQNGNTGDHYAETTKPGDGSSADYYVIPSEVLPPGAEQLQDLISFRNMNAQLGEIFRAAYRYGQGHHSPRERDLRKIIFYAQAELDRLEKYGG